MTVKTAPAAAPKVSPVVTRNFFYVNPASKALSISMAFVSAITTITNPGVFDPMAGEPIIEIIDGEEIETGEMSGAYVGTESETVYTYTNRNMETSPITREEFEAKWSAGYFTETPETRKSWFNAEGVLIRKREDVGQARKVDAPKVPTFA